MDKIYLDYAATTPTDPKVTEAMLPFFTAKSGNPSSLHAFGQEAKSAVEKARQQVATLIGAKPEEIIFNSGGTEGDNHALSGVALALADTGNHIITTKIEHHAVIESCEWLKKRGFAISYVSVSEDGLVYPEEIKETLTDQTILVSVMHANNEIGTIQPLKEISQVVKAKADKLKKPIYFHTDAVQTAGHLPISVDELGVDLLAMSAHKLYGPKGVGALYVRKGVRLGQLMRGGAQENNRRASTENVPGIVGFGAAAELAGKDMAAEAQRETVLRDRLIEGLFAKIPYIRLNGNRLKRLPNNVNISVQFVEGESMLLRLDLEGVAASSGSACTSGTLDPSHVLLAIGLPPELAHGSLRFTLGRGTTEKEIDQVLNILPNIVEKLREMSPLNKK